MNAVLAALVAGLAAWLWMAPGTEPQSARRARPTRSRVAPTAVLALAGLVVGILLGGVSGLLWAVVAVALGATGLTLGRAALLARRVAAARAEVAHATQVVAGQLRIGSVPSIALASAAKDCPSLERPAATQAIGGDVARALQEAGAAPGREGLLSLARAWELGERTGAPIAALSAQVSDQVRTDRATTQVVDAELSGPRATARLLAGLPLVGIAMGRISGGDPLGFLTRTLAGQACLAGGVVLACAGVLWTEQMARAAQEV